MSNTFEGQRNRIPETRTNDPIKDKGDFYDRRGTNEDYKGATRDRNTAFLNRHRAGIKDRY